MEPDSWQQTQIKTCEILSEFKKITSFTVRVAEYWHRLPTEVVKLNCVQSWAACCRWLCLSRRIGLNLSASVSLATYLHPLVRYLYTLTKFFLLPVLLSFLHAEQFTAVSFSLCE